MHVASQFRGNEKSKVRPKKKSVSSGPRPENILGNAKSKVSPKNKLPHVPIIFWEMLSRK